FWEIDDLLLLLEAKLVWVQVHLDLVGLLLEHCKNWGLQRVAAAVERTHIFGCDNFSLTALIGK
ncbi:hypothetical protein AVEN_201292-1, partial [Araneus ventricosus]